VAALRPPDGPALSGLLALASGTPLAVVLLSGGHPFLVGPGLTLGLAVLAAGGTIQVIRRRLGPIALLWGIAGWVLPLALPVCAEMLGRRLAPGGARGLHDIAVLAVWGIPLLYGLGGILARAARESSGPQVALVFAAFPTIAGLLLAGLILQPAFTSLPWRNRKIGVEITQTHWSGAGLVVEAVLDTSRGLRADVRAADDLGAACHISQPSRSYFVNARIEWLDRTLRPPIVPGRYRLRMTCPELPTEAVRDGAVEIRLDLTRASEWGGRDSLREFRFRVPAPGNPGSEASPLSDGSGAL
jgi:hypothetical protein